MEIGFIIRSAHALRIVERFDAFVSIEVQADLADDPDRLFEYGSRLYGVCPERFIVSVPFTSSGIIASRRLSEKGIPVNLTLGFSARQNYLAARLGRPKYVSVFVGRLSALVKQNGLGSGEYVGEKTALASQRIVRGLRESAVTDTRQIASSFRNAKQVVDLAGLDIVTLPPAVADAYRKLAPDGAIVKDRTAEDYTPGIDAAAAEGLEFDTLWTVPDDFIDAAAALDRDHDVARTPVSELESILGDLGIVDLFPCWTPEQERMSSEEGKIPALDAWKYQLEEKIAGLDSLLTFAGLNGFIRDQKTMDARITGLVKELGQT